MTWEFVVTLIIALVSFSINVFQFRKQIRQRTLSRSESFSSYMDISKLLGSIQRCLEQIRLSKLTNSIIIEEAGKTEGMAQVLFTQSIKKIYHQYEYSSEVIDDWIKKGKIVEHHKMEFIKFSDK
jgi:hypothetical protein